MAIFPKKKDNQPKKKLSNAEARIANLLNDSMMQQMMTAGPAAKIRASLGKTLAGYTGYNRVPEDDIGNERAQRMDRDITRMTLEPDGAGGYNVELIYKDRLVKVNNISADKFTSLFQAVRGVIAKPELDILFGMEKISDEEISSEQAEYLPSKPLDSQQLKSIYEQFYGSRIVKKAAPLPQTVIKPGEIIGWDDNMGQSGFGGISTNTTGST